MNTVNAGIPIEILLVEDDLGDVRLTTEALKRSKVLNHLSVAEDGVEAMAFLRRQGKYANAPFPDLILLDLNLPRKDGRAVLTEIKADHALQQIPVVVLTTSQDERDVLQAYKTHANSYITKPVDLKQFLAVVDAVEAFWLTIVRLPPNGRSQRAEVSEAPPIGNEKSNAVSVLLVEDDDGCALLLRTFLTGWRYGAFSIRRATTLSEALAELAKGGIDIVLLDLGLPDSSRLDTFVRMHAAGERIPIVVLSGFDDEALAVQTIRQGAEDYIVKGQVDRDTLVRAISNAIERSRARQAAADKCGADPQGH